MKKGIVPERLILAILKDNKFNSNWMKKGSEDILEELAKQCTDEEILKAAIDLDVDVDWLCGSGPTLPPFGEFER